jgi:hypothetical protein
MGIARQAGYSESDLWYEWSALDGAFTLANPSLPATSYWTTNPLLLKSYTFQLRVTNLVTLEYAIDFAVLEASECSRHADCHDTLFCNGEDWCDPTSIDADSQGCVHDGDPCFDKGLICDEAYEECDLCTNNTQCAEDEFCNPTDGCRSDTCDQDVDCGTGYFCGKGICVPN